MTFTSTPRHRPAMVLGQDLGTCTGWDQHGMLIIGLYDFEPNETGLALGLLACAGLTLDFENGRVLCYSEDGSEVLAEAWMRATSDKP